MCTRWLCRCHMKPETLAVLFIAQLTRELDLELWRDLQDLFATPA